MPWDEKHVFYVWYDALINYLTAIGYGEDQERFEAWWPAVHHLIGKEIIRFHCVWWPAMCMAAGIDPPAHVQVHGWLLLGGEKMSKSSVNQISPDRAHRRLRRRPGPLPPAAGHPARERTATSRPRASPPGTTPTWPTTWATCCPGWPRWSAPSAAGWDRPPDPPAGWPAWPPPCWPRPPRPGTRASPTWRLEATWRLIRETNAELEQAEPWKADPGPAVDAVLGSALEVLRIVAILIVPAMPATAETIWTRIGLEGSPADERLPGSGAWGGYPGGRPVEKGAPLFPRRKG